MSKNATTAPHLKVFSVLKTVIHFNQKQSIRLKTYCSYGANVLGVDWENAAHDRLKIMNM
jgi:uroporphyrinogen-III decarboxylase